MEPLCGSLIYSPITRASHVPLPIYFLFLSLESFLQKRIEKEKFHDCEFDLLF